MEDRHRQTEGNTDEQTSTDTETHSNKHNQPSPPSATPPATPQTTEVRTSVKETRRNRSKVLICEGAKHVKFQLRTMHQNNGLPVKFCWRLVRAPALDAEVAGFCMQSRRSRKSWHRSEKSRCIRVSQFCMRTQYDRQSKLFWRMKTSDVEVLCSYWEREFWCEMDSETSSGLGMLEATAYQSTDLTNHLNEAFLDEHPTENDYDVHVNWFNNNFCKK